MSIGFGYDGGPLPYDVAPTSLNLASGAEMGAPIFGGLTPEDPTAALTLKGHRPFVVEESACSQPRLFTGWTTERSTARSIEASQIAGTTARAHDLTIVDLNALFGFRLISGADGNRPAETFAQRLAWILGSDYLTGLIADTGYIASTHASYTVLAADYRDGYPSAVLSDLMDRTAGWYNYFAFWDPVAAAVGLWVGQLDDAVSSSTLRISNVAADVDSVTTFFPDAEAKVVVSPTDTYSEVTVRYAHGTKRLFRSRASTATKYIRRGTTIDRPHTGAAATASAQAERFLDNHANEQDRITVTIIVPAAAAGLAVAGQRMDVKFSHLAGYTTFTSMRIVGTSLTPTNNHATHYALTLELAAPRLSQSSGSGGTFELRQAATEGNSGGGINNDLTLPAPALAGSLLLIVIGVRNKDYAEHTISGWTRWGANHSAPATVDADAIVVFAKIAAGGEQTVTLTTATGAASGTIAEYTGFGSELYAVEGTAADHAGAVATYPAHTISSPARLAVLLRFDWKTGALPNPGPMTAPTGYTLLGDSGYAAFGNLMRLTDYALNAASAAASYGTTSRGTSGNAGDTGMVATVAILGRLADIEISLPPPPEVTAIIDQINNLEYLGDIPLGLPEL